MHPLPEIKKDGRPALHIIHSISEKAGLLYCRSDTGMSIDRLLPFIWSLCNKYDITLDISIYDLDAESLGICANVQKCDGLTPEPRFRKWHGCGSLNEPTRGVLLAFEQAVIELEKSNG